MIKKQHKRIVTYIHYKHNNNSCLTTFVVGGHRKRKRPFYRDKKWNTDISFLCRLVKHGKRMLLATICPIIFHIVTNRINSHPSIYIICMICVCIAANIRCILDLWWMRKSILLFIRAKLTRTMRNKIWSNITPCFYMDWIDAT